MPLTLNFTVDADTNRQFLNGHPVVMHSHHYLSLITKLAEDLGDLGGTRILMDVVEETMRAVFDDYIRKNGINTAQERCNVGREYYSVFGLGKMVITGDENGGEVRLVNSHLDQGWVMKWGRNDKPLNYFTCGYIAAMFGAAFSRPLKSYAVTEEASIAMGEPEGRFTVKAS